MRTLELAACSEKLPPELREACRFVAHPEFRKVLDTAGEGGKVDGTISQKDVQKALKQVNDDIAKYGIRGPSSPAPSTPPSTPASFARAVHTAGVGFTAAGQADHSGGQHSAYGAEAAARGRSARG